MAYHRLSILKDGEPQVQEFLAFLVNFFLSGYTWMMANIEEVSSYGNKEKSMNRTMASLTLAPTLEDELNAVIDTGLYSDVESFVSDAVHTLLAARPELRIAAACNLYERGIFSLGKAAEWCGLTIENMKETLYRRAIMRTAPESLNEIETMARRTLHAASHPVT